MEFNIEDIQETYNNYLINIVKGCNRISELLRANIIDKALQFINQFVEGIEWLYLINDKLNKLNIKNDFQIDQIKEYLIEVNNGLELGDYTLVADMFEYEIGPFLDKCETYEISHDN